MADPQLPAALRAMNAALRSGDFAALPLVSQDLEASIQSGENHLPGQLADLQALRRVAAENQVLLDAVGRGLRQAAKRLAEITDARRGLRTYGPGGTSRAWVDQTGQGKRF